MQEDKLSEFGKWRSFFWPIHRWELKKFLPLCLIFALITFNYNLLRAYKDSMVVTANHSGAETIPFIKVWAILPGAILITFIFTRLANRYSREKVFYIMMTAFLFFFFIFTFVLFPAQDYLHPNGLADRLQNFLPPGCKGLIALFRNWTFTLFYVMSELWSTAILSVLFWGFTNEVTSVGEAKRFYGMLTIGGNLAGIGAGQVASNFTHHFYLSWLPYGKNSWDQSILFLGCAIILSGCATIAVFRWLNAHVIKPDEAMHLQNQKSEKIKMSMRKNFAYLAKSKYLICIAAIVVGYNLAMNLIEVVWKNQIKQVYPDPADFTAYMGDVMTVMGVIATILAVFFTNSFIRRSWTIAALMPACIILITGTAFFLFILSEQMDIRWIGAFFGTTPLLLSIACGSLQQVMARACKYTLFDATKEVAFIPLNPESKLKGKAAIDGVGSRIGKSGGSLIHQGLLLLFTTVSASTPYVGAIFLIVILIWMAAVLSLGKQFDVLTGQNAKLNISDPNPEPQSHLMKEGA
ncbi:MAG TPA: Npt1/Npt2 family nucleotide transporter [Chlamydiales bacterium]|nr:Npt1/Npt2 family nucleotide transporter [Chlamydiales bacterium]